MVELMNANQHIATAEELLRKAATWANDAGRQREAGLNIDTARVHAELVRLRMIQESKANGQ